MQVEAFSGNTRKTQLTSSGLMYVLGTHFAQPPPQGSSKLQGKKTCESQIPHPLAPFVAEGSVI